MNVNVLRHLVRDLRLEIHIHFEPLYASELLIQIVGNNGPPAYTDPLTTAKHRAQALRPKKKATHFRNMNLGSDRLGRFSQGPTCRRRHRPWRDIRRHLACGCLSGIRQIPRALPTFCDKCAGALQHASGWLEHNLGKKHPAQACPVSQAIARKASGFVCYRPSKPERSVVASCLCFRLSCPTHLHVLVINCVL